MAGTVCICIFDKEDHRSVEERLRRAVEEYCGRNGIEAPGMTPEQFRIERTAKGKPYFVQLPRFHFSISHSGRFWACCVAEEDVGIDIQLRELRRQESAEAASERLLRLARRFYHPDEAWFVEGDVVGRFYDLWAARESYVKYTGEGINSFFAKYCMLPEKAEEMASSLSSGQALCWQAEKVWFWAVSYLQEYALCVCTGNPIACEIVDLASD